MEKEYQNFAEEVAAVTAKVAINKLRKKGVEIIDFIGYMDYDEDEAILYNIGLEVILTGDKPITLSLFSEIRHTKDGETIGVIEGKKLLNLAEITGYQLPINIHEMAIDYALFELFNG